MTSERYRLFDVSVSPFNAREVLFYSLRTGAVVSVPAIVANSLISSKGFNHLNDYISSIRKEFKKIPPHIDLGATDESKILNDLISNEMLISREDLYNEVSAKIISPIKNNLNQGGTISSICIPTADRPNCLYQVLTSYIDQTKKFDRRISFVIVDDSIDSESRYRNPNNLNHLVHKYKSQIFYANRERRAQYSKEVSKHAGVPEDIISFALLGMNWNMDMNWNMATHGAARNALLLDTIGEMIIHADDDTLGFPMEVPEWSNHFFFNSDPESYTYDFFDNNREALKSVKYAEIDILSVHERLLGKSIPVILEEFSLNKTSLDISTMSSAFLSSIGDADRHVGISFLGTVGDSGINVFHQYLFSTGSAFRKLTRNGKKYHRLLRSRQILRSVPRFTITDSAYCIGMHLGLDNRFLLPPFPPMGRGGDGLFGSVLKQCFPGTHKGYIPRYAIQHVPNECRNHYEEDISFPRFGANDLLAMIINYSKEQWRSADSFSIYELGDQLIKMGELPSPKFFNYIQGLMLKAVRHQVYRAEQRLGEEKKSLVYWRNDLVRYIDSARKSVMRQDFPVPVDLPGGIDERLARFQSYIISYGELLTLWPKITRGAAEMKEMGKRLAKPVS